MKESIDIAKPSFLIDLGDMLIEFILNLAQHGGRYHNKYITLSNLNLHTSIKVFGNMLVFKGDELVWGDIEEGLDELAYQGYRGIRCNIKPFKREINCEEIQELKKKARYRGLEIIKFGI